MLVMFAVEEYVCMLGKSILLEQELLWFDVQIINGN